jgi:hypothetical protein
VGALLGILFLIVTAPLWVPMLLVMGAYRLLLNLLVWMLWVPRGKDVLYMNSDSPIWHDTMEHTVWPLVAGRAVRINYSERAQWPAMSLAARVARQYVGGKECNPLVIVFRPLGTRKVFRFFKAFRAYKAGDPRKFNSVVDALITELGGTAAIPRADSSLRSE